MRVCPRCGNDEFYAHFYAHQVCRLDIVVDGENEFLDNTDEGNAAASIYDSEEPYGPYTCTKCGAEYDSLNELQEMEEEA